MCLYPDPTIHEISPAGKVKHRFAARDILVWKVLRVRNSCDKLGGFAPFRDTRWLFGKTHTAPKMRKVIDIYDGVEQGLHACISRTKAKEVRVSMIGKRIFPAVIPKGSKLFFGGNRDIAADTMIVYPNLAAVEAKHGPIAPKVFKKLLVL